MFNLRNSNNKSNNDLDIINDNIDNDLLPNKTNKLLYNKQKQNKEKKQYTLEEKNELIKNTIVIPKDKWVNLEPGVFISYDKLDGIFVKGGYIQIFNKSKTGRDYFRIIFNQSDTAKGYTLYLDQIQTIYKKIDETSYYELHAIREAYDIVINKLTNKIDEQTTYIKKMEENYNNKIEKNEDKIKKVLQLVKDLHKI
jgi:hypothetical protein